MGSKGTEAVKHQIERPKTASLPQWVPVEALTYLRHVEDGTSIREIARSKGQHASTVLRQIRRFENRRDDPLVDEALAELGCAEVARAHPEPEHRMARNEPVDDETIAREGLRVLRRLCETGAVLAVAPELEKAVVVREMPDGRSVRTAVIDRAVARAMALKEWIACAQPEARIARYCITANGRNALKRLLKEEALRRGDPDGEAFDAADRGWDERVVDEGGRPRMVRYNAAESPLAVLARRRDSTGQPFLTSELVSSGERLREDFELAQMAPRTTQNWDHFLTAGVQGTPRSGGPGEGPAAARQRVHDALAELGPGLGDMALRTCCFLEGLEATEKRMGWSARSGKIVLRIALQRLALHYERTHGRLAPKIG